MREMRREPEVPEERVPVVARRWGPEGMPLTGGGGLARVPNLRVCEHLLDSGVAHAGKKDESTSCRGTVWSAWQKPPVRRKGGRAGLSVRASRHHVV